MPDNRPSSPSAKRRKNKKRKKGGASGNTDAFSDNGGTILHSGLSLKRRLFLKKSSRRIPWYDANELLDTGRGLLLAVKLFSPPDCGHSNRYRENAPVTLAGVTDGERDRLQASLRRVALWRGRSDRGGRLPHAVDVTAGLAGAILADAESNSSADAPSPHQLRNSYSSLLLRSVNGLADARRRGAPAALSVSQCCALAGLPPWIVDVRHDASHGELPPLGVCRVAALESLRFWGRSYWDELEEKLWGKGCGDGADDELVDGADSGTVSTASPEGGVYTLAFDCLARYQTAAMAEAFEREEGPKKQQQRRRVTQKDQRGHRGEVIGKDGKYITESINAAATDCAGNMEAKVDPLGVPSKGDGRLATSPAVENPDASSGKPNVADETTPSRRDGGPIPWWILGDDKPRKKRKKVHANETGKESDASAEPAVGNAAEAKDVIGSPDPSTDAAAPSGVGRESTALLAIVSASDVPSSRDCAAEFVRTTPTDVAFGVALRFLVWGRPSSRIVTNNRTDRKYVPDESNAADIEIEGPALVTLHRVSSPTLPVSSKRSTPPGRPDLDARFEQLRIMYAPLLIAMTNAYPGFVPALFTHLADSILCLDDARRNQVENGVDAADCSGRVVDTEQMTDHIECASRWIHYLLSREYHMHFDRSAAMYVSPGTAQQQQQTDKAPSRPEPPDPDWSDLIKPSARPIDLKKKGRRRWTPTELEHMQGSVGYPSLHRIRLPLNSVCDRLRLHLGGAGAAGSVVARLLQFLEGVVGEERVENMGLYDHRDEDVSAEQDWSDMEEKIAKKETTVRRNVVLDNAMDEGTRMDESNDASPTTDLMSLEDMEAMLENTVPGDDAGGNSAHPDRQYRVDMDHFTNNRDGALLLVKPWTLCKTWDACAIGTMPGYPA